MLYLIGTHHNDLFKGPGRLRTILDKIKPDTIFVGESAEVDSKVHVNLRLEQRTKSAFEQLRSEHGDKIARKILDWYTNDAYEVWVPDQYVKDNPETQIHYVDPLTLQDKENLDKADAPDLEAISKLPIDPRTIKYQPDTPDEVASMDLKGFQKYIDEKYDETRNDLILFTGEKNSVIKTSYRDNAVSDAARSKYNPSTGVAVVMGLHHIFGDYHPNLADNLSDLNPKLIKLPEATKLRI